MEAARRKKPTLILAERVRARISQGHFRTALLELKRAVPDRDIPKSQLRCYLAELLEKTGSSREAKAIATDVLSTASTAPNLRARCEIVAGLCVRHEGDMRAAIEHFRRALSIAEQEDLLEERCWAQMRLMHALAEDSGLESAQSIKTDARRSAIRLGNPHVTATFHLFAAEIEGKRGSLAVANKHVVIARGLLKTYPNVWLESLEAISSFCISYLSSEVHEAWRHARRGLRLAHRAGHVRNQRVSLLNLANLSLHGGDLQKANECLEQARAISPDDREVQVALLDTFAELKLLEREPEQCEEFLTRVREAIREGSVSHPAWHERWSCYTEVQLLQLRGQWDAATELATKGATLSDASGDQAMCVQFHLHRARGLLMLNRADEAEAALRVAAERSEGASVVVGAELDSLLGKALVSRNRMPEAAMHYERALRVLSVAGSAGIRAQTTADYAQALTAAISHEPAEWAWERELFSIKPKRVTFKVDGAAPLFPAPEGADDFAALASLIDFAEHPELLGHELITLLLSAHCAGPIALVSRTGGGKEDVIAYAGCAYPDAATLSGSAACTKRLALGKARGRELELLVSAPDDLATQMRLLAIEKVLHAGLALHRARRQQREEASLVPVDAIVDSDIGVFAAPSMLQLLAVARKASTSNIGILITGETGTGKEILAHAIHESSPRAERPFIPFNCVAVPREMLDSQLFGYRRGAFTGAVEAFTGVIRAAAGGTLFLDEIGELPLELQPKLLRFLDTRDIHPLGEAAPVKVDVRVIAATNRNLDELVKEGRFREDLYYRLNIMRFSIPPLRERREEIPILVQHFLRRSGDELQKEHVRIADETLEYLVLHRWPGNVRQLANEIRRMVALAEPGAVLMPEHLEAAITAGRRTVTTVDRETAPLEFLVRMDQPLPAAFEHVERAMLPYALNACEGSLEDAAKMLGITRKGLYLKRQRLGL